MDVTLRPAQIADAQFLHSLQTAEARRYSRNPCPPTWPEHRAWLAEHLPEVQVIEAGGEPCGSLRVHPDGGCSIIVAPALRQCGIGTAAISLAEEIGHAIVHEHNVASRKMFAKAGFIQAAQDGEWQRWERP